MGCLADAPARHGPQSDDAANGARNGARHGSDRRQVQPRLMQYVVINGLPPYDGRYEFEFIADLTIREWGMLRRFTGYMPLTVEDGFSGMDPELLAFLAVLAVLRAGRIETTEVARLYE